MKFVKQLEVSFIFDGNTKWADLEKEVFSAAFEQCRGNETATARLLGVTRETVRYRLRKFRLKPARIDSSVGSVEDKA